ncbi:hypothetical protein pipiens_013884 [Culex pipiens pipiens]|uniref:Peptidase S1 domain-containing protein n=1 Tax=Culex pipiens pipiens TaxID=38569 RepID=A0ABD1CXB1_CULPP
MTSRIIVSAVLLVACGFLVHESLEAIVSNIISHEQYNANSQFENNIALLVLNQPFELLENVQLICLPPPNFSYGQGNCVTGGWGKIHFGDTSQINIMKRVQLPIVDRYQCQDALRTTKLGPAFALDESYICAGGHDGVDACTGDGGAALACPDASGRVYHQVGIVAWGVGCGLKNIPAAYTNVAMFSGWIEEKLRNVPEYLL